MIQLLYYCKLALGQEGYHHRKLKAAGNMGFQPKGRKTHGLIELIWGVSLPNMPG